VGRFFFFFSRSLFFDLLPFVVERPGLEEVSSVNMVLLAGRALVPAAAVSLIPDLMRRSTAALEGLKRAPGFSKVDLSVEVGIEEMRLRLLILEVDSSAEMLLGSFVEAAAAPAGRSESFVKEV